MFQEIPRGLFAILCGIVVLGVNYILDSWRNEDKAKGKNASDFSEQYDWGVSRGARVGGWLFVGVGIVVLLVDWITT